MESKRGISPVIATVLLIVIAIVLFLLIFLWLRGFQKEVITKYQGTPIETTCLEISFDTVVSESTLQIINTGDVPIYKAKVYYGNGGMTHLTDTDTIAQGGIIEITDNKIGGTECEKLKIIPILLGKNEAGVEREYTCENQAEIVPC